VRAAIIGAGLAGLSAADALVGEGWEVEVLEARDRVGGRTWSRTLPNGALIEMGAEFILPGNIEVERLAHELGLGVWDKGMRYGKREPRRGRKMGHVTCLGATLDDALATAAAIKRELGIPGDVG